MTARRLVIAVVAVLAASAAVAIADPASFTITTVAGDGNACVSPPAGCGDGGPAGSATLHDPFGVAVDQAGDLLIADQGDNEIREVRPGGQVVTVAGNGTPCGSPPSCGDGGAATNAQLKYPTGVTIDGSGDLLIADRSDHEVRRVSPSGQITTIAGNGTPCGSPPNCGDGGPATAAQLRYPSGVAVDSLGNVIIADQGDDEVRIVSPSGVISTLAGNGTPGNPPPQPNSTAIPCVSLAAPTCGDGGPATAAQLTLPAAVAVDPAGEVLIADTYDNEIRKVDLNGNISTIAGKGGACSNPASCGDGAAATAALLSAPRGVVTDQAGDVFIADTGDSEVRELDTTGKINTVAGNGQPCTVAGCGDGGPAVAAELTSPTGLAVDPAGDLRAADYSGEVVRALSLPPGTTPPVTAPLLKTVPPEAPKSETSPISIALLSCGSGAVVSCTGKLAPGDVALPNGGDAVILTRGRTLYATGIAAGAHHGTLTVGLRRALKPGTYAVTLLHRHGRRTTVNRSSLVLVGLSS